MSNLANVNETNFETEVLQAQTPVLVDFWASWCGYCTRLAPIMEEIAGESGGKLKVVKSNVDESKSLAQKYNIMALPTMVLFKNGKPVETITGFIPKTTINAKISQYL